ncbi:hypothetical protein DPX39_110101200 [Trypanosoma brucei equiperdum]|uniref:Transmembrane protein n=1 Tax=Trypanosoma brucei equiperdum TaxID=630700 RepID=A0A3L6KUI0_9TRYP|nr:hypothetical protein DPX39_110101200 [Trypanosoma brucei equiperdum]
MSAAGIARHGGLRCSRALVQPSAPMAVLVRGCCCWYALRFFAYSPYDSIRKPPKGKGGSRASCNPIKVAGMSVTNSNCGFPDRACGESPTPWKFPETLKSGRYKDERQRRRRYEGPKVRDSAGPDRRFYRRLKDFREVQDDDPYAGVFNERDSVKKQRVKEWQRQFEEENADVELPYERTNVLARLPPNWFVRYFVNMRDRGGADSLVHVVILAVGLFMTLWIIGRLFYTPPSQARPISELR